MDAADFVQDYYALLPSDTKSAWDFLSEEVQAEVGSYGSYQGFWKTVDSVQVGDVETVEDGVVDVSLTYVTGDGAQSETRRSDRRRGRWRGPGRGRLRGLTLALRVLALLLDPLGHAQEPQPVTNPTPPTRLPSSDQPKAPRSAPTPKSAPAKSAPIMNNESSTQWNSSAAGQERAEQDRGHQLHPEILGGVVHPGHQGDDRASEHGEREAASVDAQLGVMGADLDRGGLEVGAGDDDDPHDQRAADQVHREGDAPQAGEPDESCRCVQPRP